LAGIRIETFENWDLIPHVYNGEVIGQRRQDGYVNATAMCQANGKLFADYIRLDGSQVYMVELSRSMGIPIDLLTTVKTTGRNEERGTWIHPRAAISLARWCPVTDHRRICSTHA